MRAMSILGIDIGGTFTDFVLLHNGTLTIHKILTTPEKPSQALIAGVAHLGTPSTLIHGTTVATNALLERRGATTVLLTTQGFGDVVVIGRGDRPALYDLDLTFPPHVVPREQRFEVAERVAADGTILQPLDPTTVDRVIAQIRHLNGSSETAIEAIAICFLHSYRNSAHEERATAMLQEAFADMARPPFLCRSSEVLPEYREYERMSTTVVNAYVAPILDRYLQTIEDELAAQAKEHNTPPPTLRIMASDGGSMTTTDARHLAARTTLSGPAGGVVGARAVASQANIERIITFDMGGTSTDVALCDNQTPQTHESSIGGDGKGGGNGGMVVRFPSIDIHTVGAGGGSIARIDAGGALRVGPQSAGADPGPACYGHGTLPTVTDANLVLGRLRSDKFLGEAMSLDLDRAYAALAPLATALERSTTEVALGIVRVANAAMERAIRTISVERGIDPRTYTLVAFGGAGPLHAAHLADALGMRRVLIPRYPGVLSALGMLTADVTRDYTQTLTQSLDAISPDQLLQEMQMLAAQAKSDLAYGSHTLTPETEGVFSLDMRYIGQSHEINTPLATWDDFQPALPDLARAAEEFHTIHKRHSGHALHGHPIEVVALRLKAIRATGVSLPQHDAAPPTECDRPVEAVVQAALESTSHHPHPTAIYHRDELQPGDRLPSPAIVVQLDTTCVVPSGWQATVDSYHNLLLARK